jgi:hypothetical protein
MRGSRHGQRSHPNPASPSPAPSHGTNRAYIIHDISPLSRRQDLAESMLAGPASHVSDLGTPMCAAHVRARAGSKSRPGGGDR